MNQKLLGYLGALANPKRYAIIEALSQGEETFSKLMERTGIKDSSLLIFHLRKLKGLVEREDGHYTLTHEGSSLYDLLTSFQEPEPREDRAKGTTTNNHHKQPRGDLKRTLTLRIILMCFLIVPLWVIQRSVPLGSSWPWFLLFLGPIAAGFYAGITCRTYRYAIYASLLTSGVVTILFAAMYMHQLYFFEVVDAMARGFAMFLGLLALGVVPALVVRGLHGGGVTKRSSHVQEEPS